MLRSKIFDDNKIKLEDCKKDLIYYTKKVSEFQAKISDLQHKYDEVNRELLEKDKIIIDRDNTIKHAQQYINQLNTLRTFENIKKSKSYNDFKDSDIKLLKRSRNEIAHAIGEISIPGMIINNPIIREASRAEKQRNIQLSYQRSRRGSPRRGSPRRGSPRRGSPKRSSPRRGSPRRGSPRRGSPRRGSPRRSSPRRSSPRGSPRSSPRRGSPKTQPRSPVTIKRTSPLKKESTPDAWDE